MATWQKIALIACLALVVDILANHWLFPFDYEDQHLLKVQELSAAHAMGKRRLTPIRDLVATPEIAYVCQIGSYRRSLNEDEADFESQLRAIEKFPPVPEGPDLFGFFDEDRKLISTAYWSPNNATISTASNLPNDGIMSDYHDGHRCVSTEDGIVESLATPKRFYFSIMHAPKGAAP